MSDDLFDGVEDLPTSDARRRYSQLVGLDEIKARLEKEAKLLLFPELLQQWSAKHYGKQVPALRVFRDRPPLFVFGGDVGTGKTQLAETFGSLIAHDQNKLVRLRKLSLNARGAGAVGEMTRLVGAAFNVIVDEAKSFKNSNGRARGATILVIDEADALAQSRELAQMHHEDRAGVNAVIRGIDMLSKGDVPALVIMCTNRMDALDPAIRRRAAALFTFARPGIEQRFAVLESLLCDFGFTHDQILLLAKVTGDTPARPYGFTYSDLTQRFLPTVLLDACPDEPLRFGRVIELAKSLPPTAPFEGERAA